MFLKVDTPLEPEHERLVSVTIDCGLEVHRVHRSTCIRHRSCRT